MSRSRRLILREKHSPRTSVQPRAVAATSLIKLSVDRDHERALDSLLEEFAAVLVDAAH